MRGGRFALTLLLAALPALTGAADFLRTEVTHEDSIYRVDFEVRLAAPAPAIHRLLTDYDRLDRLSPRVAESRRLPARAGGPERLRLVVEVCVWVFCRRLQRVMDIEPRPEGDILSLAEPKEGDFAHVREQWRIYPEAARTRLRYEAEYTPAFFVPPLLGPWLIRHKLHDELVVVVERLEALANERR
jgi:hypothetical protein